MKWNILSEYKEDADLVSQILSSRGIVGESAIKDFLNVPNISYYVDQFSDEFKDSLFKAREIIISCIKKNIPIVIHGDYDADGICATAILYNTIKSELCYNNVFYFIPSRFENGYGLSVSSIDELGTELKSNNADTSNGALIITVDCGITAVNEVTYAQSLGYKIIVTDHHQPPAELPKADCIVWNDKVVGSGISWLLSRALGSKNKHNLALAALATVTDLQPVLDLNRVLVKKGLEVINYDPPLGIKKLLDVAGRNTSEIGTYELGWVIGPRINASGRLVKATEALKLFIEENITELDTIARRLNETNMQRQDKTLQMFEMAALDSETELPNIIFSVSESYHEGIIGLVAAKLVQRYYRPSIVISLNNDIGKGSVRSISGIDIISLLRRFETLFDNIGGHPMAAGFTIKKENIQILQDQLLETAKAEFTENSFEKNLNIDLLIPSDKISLVTLQDVDDLKPFGLGNEEPVFATKNMGITSVDKVGQNAQHLMLKLFDGSKYFKAIFFGEGQLAKELRLGDKIDIAYTLKKNEYGGNITVDIILKDIKKVL